MLGLHINDFSLARAGSATELINSRSSHPTGNQSGVGTHMAGNTADLVVGEIIEIKYRTPLPAFDDRDGARLSDRWIMAEVIHHDGEAPPMARLSDGQLTDIRAYMTWRRISRMR